MNENYAHPPMPLGIEEKILKGMYVLSESNAEIGSPVVQLMGSGTILREVIAGAELLKNDFSVAADLWSVPSFNQLRRDGLATQRGTCSTPRASRA